MSFTSVAVVGTVPAGGVDVVGVRYSSFVEAVNTEPPGALIILMPGVHSNTGVTINKKLTIIGYGADPGDTIIQATTTNCIYLDHDADLALEHLRVEGLAQRYWDAIVYLPSGTTTAKLNANRCVFNFTNDLNQGFFAYQLSTGAPNRIQLKNCDLIRGFSHFMRMDLSGISLEKCFMPNAYMYQCSNSFFTNDYVNSATVGYGAGYGLRYIDTIDISQRAIDLHQSMPVTATIFQWDNPHCFVKVETGEDKAWHCRVVKNTRFGIYYLSRDNRCPPIIHGPYTAE